MDWTRQSIPWTRQSLGNQRPNWTSYMRVNSLVSYVCWRRRTRPEIIIQWSRMTRYNLLSRWKWVHGETDAKSCICIYRVSELAQCDWLTIGRSTAGTTNMRGRCWVLVKPSQWITYSVLIVALNVEWFNAGRHYNVLMASLEGATKMSTASPSSAAWLRMSRA